MADTILAWIIAMLPSLPFPLLCLTYRRSLEYKRSKVESLLSRGTTFKSYLAAFGPGDSDPRKTTASLFALSFGTLDYFVATLCVVLVVTIGVVTTLTRAGIELHIPSPFEHLMQASSTHMVAGGFVGAYLWVVSDVLQRHHNDDMSPSALHFHWVRLLAASVAAPLIVGALAIGTSHVLQAALAFGVGTFPTQTLLGFARNLVKDKLHLATTPVPTEGPTLDRLQGMTDAVIDRLEDEGVNSTEHLAYVDPLRLMLRTNLEWVVIIDLIDQALLFNYVDDKIVALRAMGIRGSIELARIGEDIFDGNDPNDEAEAQETLTAVAERIGTNLQGARYLAQTMWEDQQVQFIWDLFGEVVEGARSYDKGGGETMSSVVLPLSPELIISGVSAVMQAVQTWLQLRDRRRASEPLARVEEQAPAYQAEGQALQNIVPPDVLHILQQRAQECWLKYKEVLDDERYLPPEIDKATKAVQECICRELRRIKELNGSVPPGVLSRYWTQYSCER